MIYRLNPDVLLCRDEDADLWRYATRWGDIRDVYGLIGAIVQRFCRYGHGITPTVLKDDAFGALYVGMVNYQGERSIGEYASYHVYRALRKLIEDCGDLRLGQPYMAMRSGPRLIELTYWPREITASQLAEDVDCLDWWPAPDSTTMSQVDRSEDILVAFVSLAIAARRLPATAADQVMPMHCLLVEEQQAAELAHDLSVSERTIYYWSAHMRSAVRSLVDDGLIGLGGYGHA